MDEFPLDQKVAEFLERHLGSGKLITLRTWATDWTRWGWSVESKESMFADARQANEFSQAVFYDRAADLFYHAEQLHSTYFWGDFKPSKFGLELKCSGDTLVDTSFGNYGLLYATLGVLAGQLNTINIILEDLEGGETDGAPVLP